MTTITPFVRLALRLFALALIYFDMADDSIVPWLTEPELVAAVSLMVSELWFIGEKAKEKR